MICLAVPCSGGIKGSCAKNAEIEIACGGDMETPTESCHSHSMVGGGTKDNLVSNPSLEQGDFH